MSSSSSIGALSPESLFPNNEFLVFSNVTHNGRRVVRYVLNDEVKIESAIQALQNLAKEPRIRPAYPVDTELLKLQLQEKKYLILNNDIVCITDRPIETEQIAEELRDMQFTTCLLVEPVTCRNGHAMEKRIAEIWIEIHKNSCPANNCNAGFALPLNINPELQKQIKNQNEKNEKLHNLSEIVDLINAQRSYYICGGLFFTFDGKSILNLDGRLSNYKSDLSLIGITESIEKVDRVKIDAGIAKCLTLLESKSWKNMGGKFGPIHTYNVLVAINRIKKFYAEDENRRFPGIVRIPVWLSPSASDFLSRVNWVEGRLEILKDSFRFTMFGGLIEDPKTEKEGESVLERVQQELSEIIKQMRDFYVS